MAPQRVRSQPALEVQVQPHDIRRGVRYLFFTRRQLALATLAAGVYLAFVGWTLTLLPGAVRSTLDHHVHQSLIVQRAQQGERLQLQLRRLRQLSEQTDDLRVRMQKIYLAYGLSPDESIGQGGFPFQAGAVPASIFSGAIRHGNELRTRVAEQLQVIDTFLDELRSFEAAHQSQVRTTPSLSPLASRDFVLTSPFGTRRNPFTKAMDFHAGVDLAAAVGTPIRAPADGVVVFAGRYPLKRSVAWWRYGNLVVLRHDDRFVTLYGHCHEISVRRGQRVRQGEVLATVGNSGWSTNPHLHYEVRRAIDDDGPRPVDPRIYILDHRWRDEERVLIQARQAPDPKDYEPLPSRLAR